MIAVQPRMDLGGTFFGFCTDGSLRLKDVKELCDFEWLA